MEFIKGKTGRGFVYCLFKDLYGEECLIQKSSLASEDAVWFGVDSANPVIMASKVFEGGTGWVKYPIHPDVNINTRMHLSRDQVRDLIPVLQKFVDTGEL